MFVRAARIGSVVIALVIAAGAYAQTRRAPTVDDLLDLVQVSSAQISPDGSRVIYTRSDPKPWTENKRVSSIWIARSDGSEAYQFLGHERDRSPAWSPDGTWVAFLSSRDQAATSTALGPGGGVGEGGGRGEGGGGQIWVIRADGGEALKLTEHKGTIRSFEWTADSKQIVFSSENARSDEEQAARKAGDDAIYVDEGANGQTRGRFSKLWVIGIEDKKERAITSDDRLIGDFMPSPDGSDVAFTYRRENARNHQYKSEVAVVNVVSGLVRDLTTNGSPEGSVRWSPDGKSVSFAAPDDKTRELAEPKLWMVPVSGGAAKRIVDFQGRIGNYWWKPDGRTILLSASRNGRAGVYEADVATGNVKTIATGDWSGGLDSVTRDLTKGAGGVSSPSQAGDVHVWNLASGTSSRVTHVNPQLTGFELAQFRPMKWKSKDGLEIEGMLWLPSG